MNLIFMWIIAETAVRTTLEMLTRLCPKCGRWAGRAEREVEVEYQVRVVRGDRAAHVRVEWVALTHSAEVKR